MPDPTAIRPSGERTALSPAAASSVRHSGVTPSVRPTPSGPAADRPSVQPSDEASALARTGRVIQTLVWFDALLVMFTSAGTVYTLLVAHGAPRYVAIPFGFMVDIALIVALIGDRELSRHGKRLGWSVALRWITAAMTLALNVAGSLAHHPHPDYGGAAIHSVPPVLLVVLTEAASAFQLAFAELSGTAPPTPVPSPTDVRHTTGYVSPPPPAIAAMYRPTHRTPDGFTPTAAEAPLFETHPVSRSTDGPDRHQAPPTDDHSRAPVRRPAVATDDHARRAVRRPAPSVDDQAASSVQSATPVHGRSRATDGPRTATSRQRPALSEKAMEYLHSARPSAHALAARGEKITRDKLGNELRARGVKIPNAELGPIAAYLAAGPLPAPQSAVTSA